MLIVVMKEVEVKEIGFNVHIILLYSYSSNTYMLIITCISRTLCSLLCYYFSGVGNVVCIRSSSGSNSNKSSRSYSSYSSYSCN